MRADYVHELPGLLESMRQLMSVVETADLDPLLLELVKIRASQINGCSYCLDLHTKDAAALGEMPQRLALISAWPEAPCYTLPERAALQWRECLTRLPELGAPDSAYQELAANFTEPEVVALTLAVVAINGWNRLAVGLRAPVGGYVSQRTPAPPSR
ncbi:MAG TPA: carboxymuconolactone decarboxylase family protein [Candidatus Micrarchaeaceae archaeon]|nr:carboxymuconolactone decarboxylase family protein [Candidatus Micrarchaeaceae archaeon]HVB13260.1 carboxymuconolactone decarboxylase family protein [Candidatus Dormibacteraeota bacterium]